MPTNPYFNKTTVKSEQTLVQDLVDESIKIHGIDMVYLPRTLVNVDEIFGEDKLPKFEKGKFLEMYVEDFEGFEGEGETMTQFGLEIKDNLTLTVSRRRFLETFAAEDYPYPREGDLVFFPLNNSLFEIDFVEREYNFFSFGKTFAYQIKCSLVKYSGGDFESGFDQIDGVTSAAVDKLFTVSLTGGNAGAGTGEFTDGERAHLYTNRAGSVTSATVDIIEWDTSVDIATVRLVDGTTVGATAMVGASSGASYGINTIGLTAEYFVKDAFEDNTELDREAKGFLDFTNTDPFSEGDF